MNLAHQKDLQTAQMMGSQMEEKTDLMKAQRLAKHLVMSLVLRKGLQKALS
jgi:hypothetical protein